MIKAIVAVCEDWGIGLSGDMVVHNSEDMRHFVRCTKGHAVLMGRKTLESFPGGRPLRDRRNIVLTHDRAFSREGVEVAYSVEEALELCRDESETWVIGGGEVYRQLMPYCSEAVVTKNLCAHPVDTYFPNLDDDPCWKLSHSTPEAVLPPGEGDEGLRYRFDYYERIDGGASCR